MSDRNIFSFCPAVKQVNAAKSILGWTPMAAPPWLAPKDKFMADDLNVTTGTFAGGTTSFSTGDLIWAQCAQINDRQCFWVYRAQSNFTYTGTLNPAYDTSGKWAYVAPYGGNGFGPNFPSPNGGVWDDVNNVNRWQSIAFTCHVDIAPFVSTYSTYGGIENDFSRTVSMASQFDAAVTDTHFVPTPSTTAANHGFTPLSESSYVWPNVPPPWTDFGAANDPGIGPGVVTGDPCSVFAINSYPLAGGTPTALHAPFDGSSVTWTPTSMSMTFIVASAIVVKAGGGGDFFVTSGTTWGTVTHTITLTAEYTADQVTAQIQALLDAVTLDDAAWGGNWNQQIDAVYATDGTVDKRTVIPIQPTVQKCTGCLTSGVCIAPNVLATAANAAGAAASKAWVSICGDYCKRTYNCPASVTCANGNAKITDPPILLDSSTPNTTIFPSCTCPG